MNVHWLLAFCPQGCGDTAAHSFTGRTEERDSMDTWRGHDHLTSYALFLGVRSARFARCRISAVMEERRHATRPFEHRGDTLQDHATRPCEHRRDAMV